MKLSSLIGHVAELYNEISASRKPADHLIDIFFRGRKYLGSHDRRFIAETVYAMLRHRKRIEWITSSVQPTLEKSVLLCVAVLLLENKSSVEILAEEQIDSKENLQTIQTLATIQPAFKDEVKQMSMQYSFEEWMIEKWIVQFGNEETEKLCSILNTQAPITLRVNTLKTTVEECQQSLKEEGIESVRTQFSPFGLHLQKRINVFQLATFRKGFFEVQDEGSQMLALVVNPKPRSKVIDACAGGGGKSLAMAALMKNRGEIFSLDIHEFKLDELRKRIKRAGTDTIRIKTVSENEIPLELTESADYVLVDAPCTGTGTIRRNPGMKWSVTPTMVNELQQKQQKILSNYAKCVKKNGVVVYATCSLMRDENESVIEKFLGQHPNYELMNPKDILLYYHLDKLANDKYFQLLPHQHGTDGFFAAILKRKQ